MTKISTFEGKNVDLKTLYDNVKGMVLNEKFNITKDEATENSYHLRAIKTGVARIIIGATRDIEVIVAGEPDAFAVCVMVGAWGKNIAFSTATGYIVATAAAGPAIAAGAIAAAGSFVSAKTFEENFFNKITDEIEKLSRK